MNPRRVDDCSAEEAFAWHREDSPDCPEPGLSLLRDGFGCRSCGWLLEINDQEQP